MSIAPELESLDNFEMLPPIEDFFALIDRIAAENPHALKVVGGNILLHIPEVATRTIITQGLRRGVHHQALDETIDFALVCEEWVLLELLDDSRKPELEPLIEAGYLHFQGDFKVWERYLDLGDQKNALSLRAGLSTSKPAAKKAMRNIMK
jgi:hypothetical protein